MDDLELQKRIFMAERRVDNLFARICIDLGLSATPVYEMRTAQGIIDILGKLKMIVASNDDLIEAKKTLEKADERYRMRKRKEELAAINS